MSSSKTTKVNSDEKALDNAATDAIKSETMSNTAKPGSSTMRVSKELKKIKATKLDYFKNLVVDESNIMSWEGLLIPTWEPYKEGAFRVKLEFPKEYPFKAPSLKFMTKIYHPNVSEDGNVCLNILDAKHWKPSVNVEQILQALFNIINKPEVDHPLRTELADQFKKKLDAFKAEAKKQTKAHAEKIPTESETIEQGQDKTENANQLNKTDKTSKGGEKVADLEKEGKENENKQGVDKVEDENAVDEDNLGEEDEDEEDHEDENEDEEEDENSEDEDEEEDEMEDDQEDGEGDDNQDEDMEEEEKQSSDDSLLSSK